MGVAGGGGERLGGGGELGGGGGDGGSGGCGGGLGGSTYCTTTTSWLCRLDSWQWAVPLATEARPMPSERQA